MNETKPVLNASGIRWLWGAALIVVADQLTKLWIMGTMEMYERIHVLPVFDLYRTFNTGAAWSMGAGTAGARWLFTGVAIVVSIVLVYWLRTLALSTHRLLIAGLTLILGGAVGNVIDRLRLGHVVDFLSFHWGNAAFPAFNVADSAICVGAGFVIIDSILDWWRARQAKLQASREH